MFHSLRQRSKDEGGFTLIELLVVILIIGILAAIAIPAFLNQKSKANDASAKSQARTAETAAETYSTDNNGSYEGMTTKKLEEIEPTLKETGSAIFKVAAASATGYTVESESVATKDKFEIIRSESGIERKCGVNALTNKGGCPGATSAGAYNGSW